MAVGLAGVLAIATVGTALAGWCWSDPVIGVTAPGMKEADVSIDVGVPDENRSGISVVEIVVTVPSNVNARVKFMDNVLPEKVTILKSSELWQPGQTVKVSTKVLVVSIKTFDVAHTIHRVKADGTVDLEMKTGKSNDWVTNEFGLEVTK